MDIDKVSLLESLTQEYSNLVGINQQNREAFEESKTKYETLITNIKTLRNKLEVEALVPVGNKALFYGKLIHTNEVLVQMGETYFVQCTGNSAREIAQNRIKKLNEMLVNLGKEAELYSSWEKETRKQFSDFSSEIQEITEFHTEEEENQWRIKHGESVKKHHKQLGEQRKTQKFQEDDEELWMKLNQLEIEEEISQYAQMEKEKQESLKSLQKQKSLKELPKSKEHILTQSLKSEKTPKSVVTEKQLNTDEINDLLKDFVTQLKESERLKEPEVVKPKVSEIKKVNLHSGDITVLSAPNKKLIIEKKRRVSFSPEVEDQNEDRGDFKDRMVLSFMKNLEIDEIELAESDESASDPLSSDSDGEWPLNVKTKEESKEPARIHISHTQINEEEKEVKEEICDSCEIQSPADIWKAFRNKNEIVVKPKEPKSILKKESKYGPNFPPPVFNFKELVIEEVDENPEVRKSPLTSKEIQEQKDKVSMKSFNERDEEGDPGFLKKLKEVALEVKPIERKEFDFMHKKVIEKSVNVEEFDQAKGDAIMEMLSQYKTLTRQDNEPTKETKPISRFKQNQM